MRTGEIIALHRPDLHFAKRLIHVRPQSTLIKARSLTNPTSQARRWSHSCFSAER